MRDEWFIRGKVPMTKSEVRTVSLSKLELRTVSSGTLARERVLSVWKRR